MKWDFYNSLFFSFTAVTTIGEIFVNDEFRIYVNMLTGENLSSIWLANITLFIGQFVYEVGVEGIG